MKTQRGMYLILVAFVAALAFTSFITTLTFFDLTKKARYWAYLKAQERRSHSMRSLDSYSYLGSDQPRRLPVEQKFIKMLAEESVHFDITTPEANTEWLWTASAGDNHVRVGKDKHMYAVAMFHELHCIRTTRAVMENGWETVSEERRGHFLHCFNYIRQYILCAADTTLEPGDFTKRNFTTSRIGATHTCVDWEPAYKEMDRKWAEWNEFRVQHGFPEHNEVT